MSGYVHDLRFALRSLRKGWGISAVAVISLALAIGGNTAVYSMVDAFLFRPLPYDRPERIALLGERRDDQPELSGNITASLPTWADLSERSRTLSEWAAVEPRSLALRGEDRSEPISAMAATPSFFGLLGVRAAQGRAFLPEEGVEGSRRVALISDAFRRERYGDGVPLGEVLVLNGEPHEIVGVLPAGFDFLTAGTEIWVPLARSPEGEPRDRRDVFPLARMTPGATMERVRAEVTALADRLEIENPETQRGWTIDVYNLRYDIPTRRTRILFGLLQGTVFLVLLIACVNITNLLLARGQERTREIALRTALGAGRIRIVRQLLTESVGLGLLGGLLGLGIGFIGIGAIERNYAGFLPAAYTPRLDARVFLFTLAVAAGAGVLFGLMPALQTLRRDHAEALREGSGRAGGGGSRKRLSRSLVVAEIALSMVALGVGSMMVRSFIGIRAADPGYDGADVLTATISVPDSRYPEPEDRRRLTERILERAAGIGGAGSVALTSSLPQSFLPATDSARIPGRADPAGDAHWQAITILASPGYLETMDVELLQGRFFRTGDRADAPPVAVVNRTLARIRFPDRSPVGERVVVRGESREIVGVTADVQQVLVTTPRTASGEAIYLPVAQADGGPGILVLEASSDPHALVAPLRVALQEIDPDLILPRVLTMSEVLDRAFTGIRVFNVILGVFGVVALFMAALGTYGVLAHAVSRRRHEIGIRLALGAQPGAVVTMISRQGIVLGVVGLVLGGLGALSLVRVLRSTLQGFATVEPSTLVAIAALLFGVSVAASVLPARAAAGVDPVTTLKGE